MAQILPARTSDIVKISNYEMDGGLRAVIF